MGLEGKTPADLAGIQVEGKRLILIQTQVTNTNPKMCSLSR